MIKRIMTAVLIVASFVVFSGVDSDDSESAGQDTHDWPQFRGPDRNGSSNEIGILKSWPKEGPQVIWRVKAGSGFSGISVAGDKLYTMWDEGDEQFLFCLDATHGKELWRARIGNAFANEYGDGPRSTPLIHDKIVYAISAQSNLFAFDVESGRQVWHRDLEREFGARTPPHGYASSPLLQENRLLVEVGGAEHAAFMAFDRKSGEALWRSQTDQPAYNSPLSITINGIRQIVFFSTSGLYAVSPEGGELFWQYPWKSLCPATGISLNAVSPTFIAPNKIFVSTGYGDVVGAAVIQIEEEANSFAARALWTSKEMKTKINPPVVHHGYVLGFDAGILKCMDLKNGQTTWRARGFQKGSLILVDGHLIVLGERGKLALVEANPDKYIEKGSIKILQGKCWTSPTLAGGKLYIRNDKEMVCLNITK